MTGFGGFRRGGGYNPRQQGGRLPTPKEPKVRRLLPWVMLLVLGWAGSPSAQAPAKSAEASKTTWYFYTVAWGHQDEFLDLFARNHYPLLKALEAAGHYSRVRTYVPTYHGDGRADWTFAVELVEPANAPKVDEEALMKKLFPDQAKYKKEEQRRFEILVAHWDVPLNVVDLGKP
jgi:hypothetical protein